MMGKAAAKPGIRESALTERDVLVVLDVYKYRYLTAPQIRQLHLPSLQTAYRRLRTLIKEGYIKVFKVPGHAERVYHLGNQGAELVAEQLGVVTADLKWNRTAQAPKDYYFLRHFLKAGDFRIALSTACRSSSGNKSRSCPLRATPRSSSG